MKTIVAALAIAGALVSAASPAAADIYRFNVHDPAAQVAPGEPFPDYFFFIDNSVAPLSSTSTTFDYATTDFGTSGAFGAFQIIDDVTFYTENAGGGFGNGLTLTSDNGPQAFSGPTSSPTFQNAVYSYDTGEPNGGETLTITDISVAPPVSAAPEPGTWALMLGGVGAMGLMLRSRRRQPKLARVTA